MPRKVLLLSLRAGAGHIQAARAIENALRERHPEIETRHVEASTLAHGAYKPFIATYEALMKHAPSAWGFVYRIADRPSPKIRRMLQAMDVQGFAKMEDDILGFAPDVILATHPLPASAVATWKREGKVSAALHVPLTDQGLHEIWILDGVDQYYAANEIEAEGLKARGAAEVLVTGVPIDPVFTRLPAPRAIRRKLNLKEAPTVLVMAGGLGVGVEEAVQAALDAAPGVQVLAVTGWNEKLLASLEKLAPRTDGRLVPYGFVKNVPELAAASDLAVTKPGGVTSSEFLAAGLPMVLWKPYPGQEEANVRQLSAQGAGILAEDNAHLAWLLRLLMGEPERRAEMRRSALRIGRPDAACRIADRIALACREK